MILPAGTDSTTNKVHQRFEVGDDCAGAFDFWREPEVDADMVNSSLRSNSMATCFDYCCDCGMPLRVASLSKIQPYAAGVQLVPDYWINEQKPCIHIPIS